MRGLVLLRARASFEEYLARGVLAFRHPTHDRIGQILTDAPQGRRVDVAVEECAGEGPGAANFCNNSYRLLPHLTPTEARVFNARATGCVDTFCLTLFQCFHGFPDQVAISIQVKI